MRIIKVLPFILFLCSWTIVVGQNQDLSTLKANLETASGKNKVDILLELIKEERQNPSQAKKYAEEAYQLSKKISYAKGISTSLFYQGIYERDKDNYRKAIRSVNNGLKVARDAQDFELVLQGLEVLKTIYQKSSRPGKLAETNRLIRQVKNKEELVETTKQLEDLERLVEYKDEVLTVSEEERLKLTEENEAVLGELAQSEEERLQREAELAKLEMERVKLESEAMRLENEAMLAEKEAMETALNLEKERNLRNLAFALFGLLLFLILAGWQRYTLKRQRKLAEIERQRIQRLEEIDRLKDQFLANTSHELRTPLNGIIGIAEWLFEKGKEIKPAVLKENLSVLISAGKRLNTLVNDIMDFSRLRNAELQLHRKALDTYAMGEIVLRINRPLAKVKNLQLVNEISKDLAAVFADEDRLQQILHNLVGNAIKFTNEGIITLSAKEEGAHIVISVKDTGIGILEEKHDSIFKAFHQEDGSMVREFAGTGLGLSITRHLVDLHEGKIWVESEPEAGSCFYVSIPKTAESADGMPVKVADQNNLARPLEIESANQEQEVIGSSVSDHKVKILIVDDEPVNQHVLKNHLDAGYYSITTAMNGNDALKAIEEHQNFDLVILDVMMPKMSGYEVCERIREKYLPSELPIIMVTAKNLVKDLVEGLNTGANDYLAKPFSREEFLARVKTQLNLHKINQVTGRFVPNAFLRSLGKENITEVQLGDQVEQLVTVLFSDIRAYTTLSESMTPEENFKFVNSFYKRLGPTIDQHNGFINQYLGDAIMALFQRSPLDALKASIDFQKNLQVYNEERKRKGRRPIKSGVGFHTGQLIMGIIGDEKRMDATTISDTVNTASRIESLNKYYGTNILFSENSLVGIGEEHGFQSRFLGEVQVKGKKLPLGLYECIEGDGARQIDLKMQSLSIFNEGRDYYFNKEFSQAQKAFQAVLNINPEDEAAQVFLDKALNFIQSGVPSNWTGVEKMAVK